MNSGHATLVCALILLGLAALWVLFLVGRIIVAAVREERLRKWSERQISHPVFGALTGELGIWTGAVVRDGAELNFSVGGTGEEPDASLLEEISNLLPQLAVLKTVALGHLRRDDPEAPVSKLKLESIDLLYSEHPTQFTLNFHQEEDQEGLWRVEFENGAPVFSCFDH
jgi:hypothetical protein